MGSLLAALGIVFVAELGDKTQLVAVALGARHRLAPVLVGLVIAYAAAGLVSVAVGGVLGDVLPERVVGLAAGVLFLAFAAWSLRDAMRTSPGPAAGPGEPRAGPGRAGADRSVVVSVAVTMFVAELGDKTMLATATLAARANPVLVWAGATAGITLAGLLGVLLGRAAGARLPERVMAVAAAALFAAFGVALLVTNW